MKPEWLIAALWLLFILTHLGVSSSRLRAWFVEHLGPRGYIVGYAVLAALQLSAIGWSMLTLGDQGTVRVPLGGSPRIALIVVSALGAVLVAGGLASYARSPMAVLARRARMPALAQHLELEPPPAIERVTRHPFFVGLTLIMAAHALLASTMVLTICFSGYALLAVLGIVLQDRKLRRTHGEVYERHVQRTSALPLLALSRGPRLPTHTVLRESIIALSGGALMIALHPLWQWRNGAGFAFAIAAFGQLAVLRQLRASTPPQPRTSAPHLPSVP